MSGSMQRMGFKIAGLLFAVAGLISTITGNVSIGMMNVAIGMMFIALGTRRACRMQGTKGIESNPPTNKTEDRA